MKWNCLEIEEAAALAREIDCFRDTPNGPPDGRIILRQSDAQNLKEGLSRPDPGLLLIRHLFSKLKFDEARVFRWRFEHKLVQALILHHYCKGVVPCSAGLRRYLRSRSSAELDSILSGDRANVIIKTALGDGSGASGYLRRLSEAAEACQIGGHFDDPRDLAGESFLIQEKLDVAAEYRVHTFGAAVIPALTFRRYTGGINTQERHAPNIFVEGVIDRLPSGLLSGTLYGWDVVLTKAGEFFIIEANPAGFHPVFRRGFQCSGYFTADGGLAITGKLLEFIGNRYGVEIRVEADGAPDAEDHYCYWWVGQWLELFKAAKTICSNTEVVEPARLRTLAKTGFEEKEFILATSGLFEIFNALDDLSFVFRHDSLFHQICGLRSLPLRVTTFKCESANSQFRSSNTLY